MGAQGNYNAVFAERLRKLLENRGITITELAKHLQISRQAVSQYTDGSAQPNIEKLSKIANFFEVSSDYLIGLSEYERLETANYTASDMGISDSAAKRLYEDNIHSGISGGLLSLLANSPYFYDLAEAVGSYSLQVSRVNKYCNTVSSVWKENKTLRYKRFEVNESLYDVLNSAFPVAPFSERIKTAREREAQFNAVNSQEDK